MPYHYHAFVHRCCCQLRLDYMLVSAGLCVSIPDKLLLRNPTPAVFFSHDADSAVPSQELLLVTRLSLVLLLLSWPLTRFTQAHCRYWQPSHGAAILSQQQECLAWHMPTLPCHNRLSCLCCICAVSTPTLRAASTVRLQTCARW